MVDRKSLPVSLPNSQSVALFLRYPITKRQEGPAENHAAPMVNLTGVMAWRVMSMKSVQASVGIIRIVVCWNIHKMQEIANFMGIVSQVIMIQNHI